MSDLTEVAEDLARDGVRFARIAHPDLYGRLRSKDVPVGYLPAAAHGLGYAEASLVEGLDGEPLSGGGFPADLGHPDIHSRADLSTTRLIPWGAGDTAWILADLVDGDGHPSPLCSRQAVRRAVEAVAEQGLEPVVAVELEFYLVRDGAPYAPRTGMAYTSGPRADPEGILRGIHAGLVDLGIGASAAHREFSPGQYEINLAHGPALDAADHGALFKEAVKELAQAHGVMATFMPKPFAAHEGSGAHVHVSLTRDGANAMAGDGEHGLSPVARSFVAGLLEHAPALQAIAAPTVNSPKRFTPDGIAPHARTWGLDHRMTYLRIPAERGDGSRVEFRGADASASPYLISAAVLFAGCDGIARGLEPPSPIAADGAGHAPPLPGTLEAALDALAEDDVLRRGLGPRLVDVLLALRRRELARFARAVTDWEWSEYAFHA
jgi:glutamine synthetase